MGADPLTFWYQRELGFFDNIIPLAKKLIDYNIFGASSDECLNFALQKNRQEWETRGEAIVASMAKQIKAVNMKITAKATSAQEGVPLDTSLYESRDHGASGFCKKRVTTFEDSLAD